MPSSRTTSLTDLDRRLFAAVEHASAESPATLESMAAAADGRTREEVSGSLARLKFRGLIIELPGRRFFAPLLADLPADFRPLSEAEWPVGGIAR